jgi:type IV secretory pathway VirB4 component
MSADDRKDLHRNLADLYELDEPVRHLGTLARTCRRTYGRLLDEWTGSGRLASYFDHVDDTLSVARFQTFDFEGMDQPEVLEPLLFYILHRANVAIYDHSRHTIPKLFIFDEAWRFFRNPTTRAYIIEALKTWRKRNAVMILATQSSEDLMRDEMLSTVAESCFTKCFLANPGMDAVIYREMFHLNATEADLIARLIPKQQFLLKRPDFAKVLNLHVDEETKHVFSNQL